MLYTYRTHNPKPDSETRTRRADFLFWMLIQGTLVAVGRRAMQLPHPGITAIGGAGDRDAYDRSKAWRTKGPLFSRSKGSDLGLSN